MHTNTTSCTVDQHAWMSDFPGNHHSASRCCDNLCCYERPFAFAFTCKYAFAFAFAFSLAFTSNACDDLIQQNLHSICTRPPHDFLSDVCEAWHFPFIGTLHPVVNWTYSRCLFLKEACFSNCLSSLLFPLVRFPCSPISKAGTFGCLWVWIRRDSFLAQGINVGRYIQHS